MTPKQARQVLNAPGTMNATELTRAFRTAVKAAHPDHGGDGDRLRLVIEAHALLKALGAARDTAVFPAGDGTGESAGRSATSLEISVAEALLGGSRRIRIGGRTLDVSLPPGLRSGEALRLGAGASGGEDVLLDITIADEGRLSVRGDDLWLRVQTSGRDGRVEIATPRGPRAVWLSRKVGSRRLLRLEGEGLPARGPHRQGDLIVRLETAAQPAETPARQMLRRFAGAWAAA